MNATICDILSNSTHFNFKTNTKDIWLDTVEVTEAAHDFEVIVATADVGADGAAGRGRGGRARGRGRGRGRGGGAPGPADHGPDLLSIFDGPPPSRSRQRSSVGVASLSAPEACKIDDAFLHEVAGALGIPAEAIIEHEAVAKELRGIDALRAELVVPPSFADEAEAMIAELASAEAMPLQSLFCRRPRPTGPLAAIPPHFALHHTHP